MMIFFFVMCILLNIIVVFIETMSLHSLSPEENTILVFDTETSGFRESVALSIGYVVLHPETLECVTQGEDFLYDSDNIVRIEPGAFRVHSISDEILERRGQYPRQVLRNFFTHVRQAGILVGHNLTFDTRVIAKTLEYYGLEQEPEFAFYHKLFTSYHRSKDRKTVVTNFRSTRTIPRPYCTMLEYPYSSRWLKLADQARYYGVSPDVEDDELVQASSSDGLSKWHTALFDAQQTARVYQKMMIEEKKE